MNRYWTVWVASLLFFGAFYALIVPIPLYLEALSLPDWQIGFVLGAFGIASLFGRPLAGLVNDSLGSRPIILFGALALAAGAALMSLATDPVLLFGLRVLQAGGYVAFTTAATALVADLSPAARRGAALALFGVAANVAITVTPAAVSAALEQLSARLPCPIDPCPLWRAAWPGGQTVGAPETAYPQTSYPLWGRGIGHSAFFLSAGLSILAALLVWRAIPHRRRGASKDTDFGMFAATLSPLRGPMVTTWLFGASFGALFAFLPLLAERRELASAGAAYGVYGISIIATRIFGGRLLDRPNRSQALLPAMLVNALGLAGLAFSETMPLLLASAALLGVGSGVTHPALIAICVDRLPAARRGRAAAGFYLAFDLGIGLGSWLLGLALDTIGLAGLYGTASLLSAAGALSAPFFAGARFSAEEPRA